MRLVNGRCDTAKTALFWSLWGAWGWWLCRGTLLDAPSCPRARGISFLALLLSPSVTVLRNTRTGRSCHALRGSLSLKSDWSSALVRAASPPVSSFSAVPSALWAGDSRKRQQLGWSPAAITGGSALIRSPTGRGLTQPIFHPCKSGAPIRCHHWVHPYGPDKSIGNEKHNTLQTAKTVTIITKNC